MKRIILTVILALAALTASAQTLVVYYSKPGETYTPDGIINLKKGNTQEVAERIQKLAQADIFRVETVKAYPDDYMALTEVAKEELNAKARPDGGQKQGECSGLWRRQAHVATSDGFAAPQGKRTVEKNV